MKRGEIYYIRRGETTVGNETAGSRPDIIVSNNALNATSGVVEVVYLTSQPKKDLPTHALIQTTGIPSAALCEQIDHVSIKRLGDFCGRCTAEEMAAVDRALISSLGLPPLAETSEDKEPQTIQNDATKEHDPVNHPSHYTSGKIEVIDFIEDQRLDFCLGNAVKYIARAGKKDPAKTVEDLKKAVFYLLREVKHLEGAEK